MVHDMPSTAVSRQLPVKGEDRSEFAAARLSEKSIHHFSSVDGDLWHGRLPISAPLGKISAKPAKAGNGCRRCGIGEYTDVN